MNDRRPSTTPKAARILLGVFILWQLVFLVSSNLLSLLPSLREFWQDKRSAEVIAGDWLHEKGRAARAERTAIGITTRWAEVTGQPQNWSLFAPNVTSIVPFVAVELCWDEDPSSVRSMSRWLAPMASTQVLDEATIGAFAWREDRSSSPDINQRLKESLIAGDLHAPPPAAWRRGKGQVAVALLSDNEPRDPRHFIRFGGFRLRRYESNIDASLDSPDKDPDAVVDGWRETIEDRVRTHWRLMHGYMQWRLRQWSQKHAELPPPKQVILWVRIFRVPAPEEVTSPWNWQEPEWHPLARWQPDAEWTPGHLPVEMFNPVVGRFESIRERHAHE
jgi:hypothetical protein